MATTSAPQSGFAPPAPPPAPAPAPASLTPGAAPGPTRRAWLALAVLAALAAVWMALAPLADMDLPMHLRLGEWILAHHAVPTVEPFAWTRAGAPFIAYSWGAEIVYWPVLVALGPIGLHLLELVCVAAAFGAVWLLARRAGWTPATTLVVLVAHAAILARVVPYLRPQGLLFVWVPLAWTLGLALARATTRAARGKSAAGIAALTAVAANTHLLFPLVLVAALPPLWSDGDRRARLHRAGIAVAAFVLGALCTPYVLHWREAFAINFAPSLVLRPPTSVREVRPGFDIAREIPSLLLPVGFLLLLPWLPGEPRAAVSSGGTGEATPARQRAEAALWTLGLVAFGAAVRALAIWWLLVIPMAGVRIDALLRAAAPRRRQLVTGALAVVLGAAWWTAVPSLDAAALRREGPAHARSFPTLRSAGLYLLTHWLERHADLATPSVVSPREKPRLVATMNTGSYLAFRLPQVSESIDARTIFPDSAAWPDAMVSADHPLPPFTLIRWADLAILPVGHVGLEALRNDPAWVPLARAGEHTLWARRTWWERACRQVPDAAPKELELAPGAVCGVAGK